MAVARREQRIGKWQERLSIFGHCCVVSPGRSYIVSTATLAICSQKIDSQYIIERRNINGDEKQDYV
jgi:hypothetical protein